jgi:hypothetical protein
LGKSSIIDVISKEDTNTSKNIVAQKVELNKE